uniref:Glycosyltransferase 2-like domain-containing protein n=1 Tax=Panagrolaimus davidi TaxID=227884 RepID=A0A914QJE1_9BILA
MNPLISIVLCCHNDETGIHTTLQALEHQTMANEKFEVIVVDNASQPSLNKFVTKFSTNSSLIIRYIFEKRLGLSIARNTGVNLAKSKFIAVTDPENIPDPRWLENIYETFENNPDTVFIGGKLINNVNGKIPWFFPENLIEYFTPVKWPTKLVPIAYPYFAAGK